MRTLPGEFIDQLPVDSLEDALVLVPGISGIPGSGLSFRGGPPGGAATYIDGIPVSPGLDRADAAMFLSGSGARGGLTLGTNGTGQADLLLGPLGVEYGNASDGVIALHSRNAPQHWQAHLAYGTGEVFGSRHDPGLNRLQGVAGGRLAHGLSLTLAGVLQGQRSADSGPGADQVPVFTQAGVDTVVAVPSALFDPLADTSFVAVQRFAVYRGDCQAFAASTNPEIAGNAGQPCHGILLPVSNRTAYQTMARLDYQAGRASRLSLLGIATQQQAQDFNYLTLYDRSAFFGRRQWSQMLGLAYNGAGRLGGHAASLRAYGSYQLDRAVGGPLATLPTPALGWMVGGLDFRWDLSSFPVDDQLVANYQQNTPGSRRSPYDLENPGQYSYIDRYRNNAYGVTGFAESGGPLGRLTLDRERRLLAGASGMLQVSGTVSLVAGGEYVATSLDHYDHDLTSSANSDVYREDPRRSALWLAGRFRSAGVRLDVGVRYDRFTSGAARPYALDTVSASPTFQTYGFFPRIASYGNGTFNGKPLVILLPDQPHGALSPRLRAAITLDQRSDAWIGYARQAQVPDFRVLYSGINTDLGITTVNQPYGSDLGFERTDLAEVGMTHRLGARLRIEGALYYKNRAQQAQLRILSSPDPQRLGAPVDLSRFVLGGGGTATGGELALSGRVGRYLRGRVGYAYTQSKSANDFPTSDSHPHTLTGAVALELPASWHAGSLAGTLLGHTSVFATFRYVSGAAYTACSIAPGNGAVLAGGTCPGGIAGDPNGQRLPAFRQIDLRLTRRLTVAGHTLGAFLDARNLLDFTNHRAVFAVTGTTSNPTLFQQRWSQDSITFAFEAESNGVYDFASGTVDLSFGGAGTAGCAQWVDNQFQPSAPNCVYLIRAEQRFGNGDAMFSPAEQRRASEALTRVFWGSYAFEYPPRRLRLGVEVAL